MFNDRKRILYVDDDPVTCDMMRTWLECDKNLYDMTTVTSAVSAAQWVHDGRFNLYLLDYCLPEITGAELCRTIRSIDLTTPILIYSALSRKIDRRNAIEAGANFYLVKPDDLDVLRKTVWQLLGSLNYAGHPPERRMRRATNIL